MSSDKGWGPNVVPIQRHRSGTTMFSIFGQMEEVAADSMIREGRLLRKIPLDEFPDEHTCPGVWQNDRGQRAKFAVLILNTELTEFDKRVGFLRA